MIGWVVLVKYRQTQRQEAVAQLEFVLDVQVAPVADGEKVALMTLLNLVGSDAAVESSCD